MTQLTAEFMQFVNSTMETMREELGQQRANAANAGLEIQRVSGENTLLKKQMDEVRNQVSSSGNPFNPSRKRMFDTKSLRLDPYTGDRSSWKNFSSVLLKFIDRESPELRKALVKSESLDEEIKPEKVIELGVSAELDAEFAWLLFNQTTDGGHARSMLRACDGRTGLEQWRMLYKDAMPVGGAQDTIRLMYLMHPPKTKS